MITTRLYGRLGNQLFQICAALSFAERHGIKYAIPQSITCPPGLASDPVYFRHFPKPDFDINILPEWKEPDDQSYMEIPEAMSGSPFCLNGYFQSYKYFEDESDYIIEDAFPMLKPRPSEYKYDTVAIHVRRGDYLQKPLDHPVLEPEYYLDAVAYFALRGYREFFVFSDDIPWCKSVFIDGFFDATFSYSENKSAMEDLRLMAACGHFIIANSSFSWWGAFLGRYQGQIVIAPNKWYGPALSHINTKDLIPENWIRI